MAQNSKENQVHTLMAKEEPKNVGKIRKHLGFLKNEDAVLFEFNFFLIENKTRTNHLYDFFVMQGLAFWHVLPGRSSIHSLQIDKPAAAENSNV